jgi:D-alanyl-D-alanine carboxypeptidase
MYRALAVLTLGVLLLTGGPSQAQTLPLRILRDYIEALRIQAGIPGLAVALTGPDGIFWESAFGRQDLVRAIPTRTDTPFHVDGLTQVFTATLALRCVEEGRLSLDDRVARYNPDSVDAAATIREVLTHTSPGPDGPVFTYRPERYESLERVIRGCMGDSYRESLANLLDRLAMTQSVPGPDVVRLAPPAEGIPDRVELERYTAVLDRLALTYSVDPQRRAFAAPATSVGLTGASGLVSTVLDLASLDRALRQGLLLRPATLAQAWTPGTGADGRPLLHAMGWFSQTLNEERLVWQFGWASNGGSSLMVTVPGRGFSFILLANSNGLFKTPPITVNELIVSPFVRLLLAFSAA